MQPVFLPAPEFNMLRNHLEPRPKGRPRHLFCHKLLVLKKLSNSDHLFGFRIGHLIIERGIFFYQFDFVVRDLSQLQIIFNDTNNFANGFFSRAICLAVP